ncbi:MAG: helix-turn-helix transcriptional regulator [Vibrio sp.]|uniref:helix-turn-helix transcriptional regulator n=1 Tax=Vibrio sp. TaxID=678 RepID=UPI003A8B8C4E
MSEANQHEELYSVPQLEQLLDRNRITIWRWWKKHKIFPSPLLVNGRAVGWRKSDVDLWIRGEWKHV